jgi:hypothetical protein
MSKKMLSISESKFAKLHAKLKSLEKENHSFKIGSKNLSHFLLENTEFEDDTNEPWAIRTKRVILYIAGDYTTSPNDLQVTIRLKENLGYGEDEYTLLQNRLNKLVKTHDTSLSIDKEETDACEKVRDCIKLVEKKISDKPTD